MAKTKQLGKPLIESTADLRKMLLETIQQVKREEIDPRSARTVAALATTILQSAKLDLDFLRFHVANEGMKKAGQDVVPLLPQPQGRLVGAGSNGGK